MDILAGIFGVLSLTWLVLGMGLLLLGQWIGTWKKLTESEKPWQKKLSEIGFNYIMPAGIIITIFLIPLIILLGLVTFVVMLI